ncbi:MAG: phage late control D family protein [Succinivibrionaceae bacterium]|nr:phage late control D family protein [Succinivibrionaceae bacterium]
MAKNLSIKLDCTEDVVSGMIPYAVEVHEGISEPFTARLTMFTDSPLDEDALAGALGSKVAVEISDGTITRRFPGFLKSHEFKGIAFRERSAMDMRDACCYELAVESGLALLKSQRHTRSFVRKDVVAVIRSILDEYGLPLTVKDELIDERDFKDNQIFTQVAESDYDFICRLCLLNGLNLVQDTFTGEQNGTLYLSDAGKSYVTYLEAKDGQQAVPRGGSYRCQMRNREQPSYLREVVMSGQYRPARGKTFIYYDDADTEDFSTNSLTTCFGYYETIKESGSDDLEFVDMSDQERVQKSVRECFAPRRDWSFKASDLAARAGLVATLTDFYKDPKDIDILIETAEYSFNVNYPQGFTLHPLVRELEASVEASVACRGMSLAEKPERLPVLGDAGDPIRLLATGRAIILDGSVCDAEGRLEDFGQAATCDFDHHQDPTFFYMLPRGAKVPVVVRNTGFESGEFSRYLPRVGDHVLVTALGGKLQLQGFHPVLGQLSYLESTGMGTFEWLENLNTRNTGGTTLAPGRDNEQDRILDALISRSMRNYITRFAQDHEAATAGEFYERYLEKKCNQLSSDYSQSLREYRDCKHSLLGKAKGLSLSDEERETLEKARKKIIAAHDDLVRMAKLINEEVLPAYDEIDYSDVEIM